MKCIIYYFDSNREKQSYITTFPIKFGSGTLKEPRKINIDDIISIDIIS